MNHTYFLHSIIYFPHPITDKKTKVYLRKVLSIICIFDLQNDISKIYFLTFRSLFHNVFFYIQKIQSLPKYSFYKSLSEYSFYNYFLEFDFRKPIMHLSMKNHLKLIYNIFSYFQNNPNSSTTSY